MKHKEKINTS